ncbi:MAG: hypothetical protein MZU97_16845 [Bacillus subtilis]|nr:hypothetical protein [Bacillus subtilis]
MNILIPALVLGGTGFVLGFLIFIVDKYFHVEEDKRLEMIVSMLPGINCGACGHPGCQGLGHSDLRWQRQAEPMQANQSRQAQGARRLCG